MPSDSPTPAAAPAPPTRTVWAFVLASVGVHVVAMGVVPDPPARATVALAPVDFEVVAPPALDPLPEPEPVAPEPEPTPEPERRATPPAPRPDPEPAPEEPEPPPPLGATDLVDPTTDEIETDTVASTEGGLAVRARAGEGGGLAPTRAGRAGDPQGLRDTPTVDVDRLRRAWMIHVQRRLMRLAAQEYPLAARRARLEGVVTLALAIDPGGRIVGVDVARSCGNTLLDEAAVASALELGRVPAPPEQLAWATRAVRFPISYRIR